MVGLVILPKETVSRQSKTENFISHSVSQYQYMSFAVYSDTVCIYTKFYEFTFHQETV